MAGYAVAKEMHHPDGSKVLLAFSTEDERAINEKFAAYRAAHLEAAEAAMEGRDIRSSAASELPIRRGPGRPPNASQEV